MGVRAGTEAGEGSGMRIMTGNNHGVLVPFSGKFVRAMKASTLKFLQ